MLRKRLEQGGERAFQRGFRMIAFSDDEITFPSFKDCYAYGITLGEIQRSNWFKVVGVDLSSDKRPGNGIVTVAVDPETARRYPIDIRAGAWKSNEVVDQLRDINAAYQPHVFMCEDNGYQEALIDWAQSRKGSNDFWTKLMPTTTTAQTKKSIEIGLPSLQVEFRNQAWVIPASEFENLSPDENVWARWDYEMRNHPLASTDDLVMATWFARQGIDLFSHIGRDASEDLSSVLQR